MICRICDNSENNIEYQVKEMMFGFRDQFTYFECSKCGCLQISEIPRSMVKYYPTNYYSFEKGESNNFIKQILRRKRDEYALSKKGLIGRTIYKRYPNQSLNMIRMTGKINYDSRILDVGCGSGNLLHSLNKIGFTDLIGVDSYIEKDVIDENVKILKKTILELSDSQKFDLIIFGHSFEHIPDQLETLGKVSRLLSEQGICLIRMPVKTDYIWNRYNINWVQIDAPRHFFLHTLNSFKLLVKRSGLILNEVVFDSTDFQFRGSEQYKKDIPLLAGNSYSVNPKKSIFTSGQIKEFKRLSEELNMNEQGDQAAFSLMRSE